MAFSRDTNTLIPIMSSNTLPSGYVASAGSALTGGYDAWKVFNGTCVDNTDNWCSAGGPPDWLAIQLPNPAQVTSYSIFPRYDSVGNSPKTWTLEGSNDGTNWTTINTQTNYTNWTVGVKQTFSCSNSNYYSRHRINITASISASYIQIGELELFGTVSTGPLRLAQVF